MSKDLLGASFIKSISAEMLDSAAVNHPYLTAMRTGDFPNIDLAYKDFAFQYSFYSTKFTRYVSAVIDNLSNSDHQHTLKSNLAEENGDTHDIELPPDVLASVADQPHSVLFRRFQEALGVNSHYRETRQQCQTALLWSKEFLQLCKKNEFIGVGAIGLGTELIVSRIYSQILEGLKTYSNLTPVQRVFFDLHSVCDDEHAAQMLLITEDLAQNSNACEQIEQGARKAIELRIAFWDEMLERAWSFPAATAPAIDKLSAIEY